MSYLYALYIYCRQVYYIVCLCRDMIAHEGFESLTTTSTRLLDRHVDTFDTRTFQQIDTIM